MRKSIFDLEIRVNLNSEYQNLYKILMEKNALYYSRWHYSLYQFINDEVFPLWANKGLFVDFDDFLNKIGINFTENICDEEKFLYLLEALINLWPIACKRLDFVTYEDSFSKRVLGYMNMYIPKLIEQLNYTIINKNGRKLIIKRDSDVDSILEIVPENCAQLMLDYNDIRNNNIESKITILKKLDKYIEENKTVYKSINTDTYNSIQTIVNKMGINHPLSEEPFKSFSTDELINWYDKCFKLIIHLIRQKEVNDINNSRKKIISV